MTIFRSSVHRQLLYIVSLLFLLSTPAWCEPLIAELSLNGENRGSFFLETTDSGDFLIRLEDYRALELRGEEPSPVMLLGEAYVSLRSISTAPLFLDESSLVLTVSADPQRLTSKTIDLAPTYSQNIRYPSDTSLFFNYGINYNNEGLSDTQSLELPHELGFRYRDALLLSDAIYSDQDNDQGYVRLMSSLSLDNRHNLNRIQIGDFISSSGNLGSRLNLGGARFSRNYDIDPYFIEYPTTGYSGELSTPSRVQVLLDGVEIYSEHLPPGPFSLENILHHSGAGQLEIVITDAFGSERRIRHPFYIEDSLLKQEMHTFSYSAGTVRENFGSESNDYGDSAFQAVHRYGLRDTITVGGALEGNNELFNARLLCASLLGPYGVVEVEAGGSSGYENSGAALSLEYNYLAKSFNARALLQYFDEGYRRIHDGESPQDLTETVTSLGFGFVVQDMGSLSFDFLERRKHLGDHQTLFSVSYNRRLMRNLSMTSTFRHSEKTDSEDLFLLNLNYTPWPETQIALLTEIGSESNSEILQIQDNPPTGEGYGYRVNLEQQDSDNDSTLTLNPSGQWNARYGILKADLENVSGDQEYTSYHLSFSGALVSVGSRWGLTRPVADSFALVSVENLEGITVRQNSQISGKTGRDGTLFIPNMNAFYSNQVSIDDQQVPINYTLAFKQQHVSPPYRSGSCIHFPVTRLQPIIGRLLVVQEQQPTPLEYTLQHVEISGNRYPLHTGRGGEFYIDPSELQAPETRVEGCPEYGPEPSERFAERIVFHVTFAGEKYTHEVAPARSDELFIDIGDVVVTLQEKPDSKGRHDD